jgi:hypothetical protein
MPRDSNGNYTLPPGNPVVPETIIETDWANPTMTDLGNALSDSLSRTGKGGMLVPFLNTDGTVTFPGISWANETNMGIYRKASGQMGVSVQGEEVFVISYQGIQISQTKQIYLPDGNTGNFAINANDLTTLTENVYVPLSSKGQPNGVPNLTAEGVVPPNQLPTSLTNYQGAWDASGDVTPPNPAGGDMWSISVGGTLFVVRPGDTLPQDTVVTPGEIIIYADNDGYWYLSNNGTNANDARYVQLLGSIMTGQLTLPGGGINLDAATLVDVADAIQVHDNAANPHPQYLTEDEADGLYDPLGAGTLDHSALFNLAADDHPQYYNTTRADARYEQLVNKGVPSGYTPLDASGIIPAQYIPVVSLEFQGTWDASGGLLPPDTTGGNFYIISVSGTLDVVPADGSSDTPVPTVVNIGDYIMLSSKTFYWYQLVPNFAQQDARYLQLTGGTLTGQLSMEAGQNRFLTFSACPGPHHLVWAIFSGQNPDCSQDSKTRPISPYLAKKDCQEYIGFLLHCRGGFDGCALFRYGQ